MSDSAGPDDKRPEHNRCFDENEAPLGSPLRPLDECRQERIRSCLSDLFHTDVVEFLGMPVAERTPVRIRVLMDEVLEQLSAIVRELSGGEPHLIRLLREALAAANRGERHELLCLPQDDLTRTSGNSLVPFVHGRAAAVLERAKDLGQRQDEWAAKIATELGKVGFLSPSSRRKVGRYTVPYTGDAVRKWRENCRKDPLHPSTPHYNQGLSIMRRARVTPGSHLQGLLTYCQFYLCSTNGNV